jgi:hypothetical protein
MSPIHVCRFPPMEEIQRSITPHYPAAVTEEYETKRKGAVTCYRVYMYPNSRLEKQSYISLTRFVDRVFGKNDLERTEAEYHHEPTNPLPDPFQNLIVQICGGMKNGPSVSYVSYSTSYSLTNCVLPSPIKQEETNTFRVAPASVGFTPLSPGFTVCKERTWETPPYTVPHSVGFAHPTHSGDIPLHRPHHISDMEQLRQSLLQTQQENIRLQRVLGETQRALDKRNTEITGIRQLLHSVVERLS